MEANVIDREALKRLDEQKQKAVKTGKIVRKDESTDSRVQDKK